MRLRNSARITNSVITGRFPEKRFFTRKTSTATGRPSAGRRFLAPFATPAGYSRSRGAVRKVATSRRFESKAAKITQTELEALRKLQPARRPKRTRCKLESGEKALRNITAGESRGLRQRFGEIRADLDIGDESKSRTSLTVRSHCHLRSFVTVEEVLKCARSPLEPRTVNEALGERSALGGSPPHPRPPK